MALRYGVAVAVALGLIGLGIAIGPYCATSGWTIGGNLVGGCEQPSR